MFTLFRYGLLPVVLYCTIVIAAGVDAYSTNAVRKSAWPQTVATVLQSQDPGQVLAELQGTKNTFPDPRGTLSYVIDGKAYTWQGRGRDIGVTAMNPGDRIKLYYNPQNPEEISTLVLLGAFTGNIILTVAFAFLVFYVWFFWLRGFLGRSGPDDFDGAGSFADQGQGPRQGQTERPSTGLEGRHAAAIIKSPMARSFEKRGGATFGKR